MALTPNEVAASVLDELESAGVENISQLSGKVSQSADLRAITKHPIQTKFGPSLKAGEQIIWLISIYLAREDQPIALTYSCESQEVRHSVGSAPVPAFVLSVRFSAAKTAVDPGYATTTARNGWPSIGAESGYETRSCSGCPAGWARTRLRGSEYATFYF